MKRFNQDAHNSVLFGNRIDRSSHVSICLCGRRKNAKTANIRDITEQIIVVNSNASVNATSIIEIFATNRDAMLWGQASCRFLCLIRHKIPIPTPILQATRAFFNWLKSKFFSIEPTSSLKILSRKSGSNFRFI